MSKNKFLRRTLWMVSAIGIISLSATPRANAGTIPGSTFSIVVAGFNASSSGSLLTAAVNPVFGTTQTYDGNALAGQVLTVTSNETVGATRTTDVFTISVPTNFAPSGTAVGTPAAVVTHLEVDLGGYNAGADPLDFSDPLVNLTVTGFMTYSGGNFTLSPGANDVLSNGNESLYTAEGVTTGNSSIEGFAVNSFTFDVAYDNPIPPAVTPEPGTLSLVGMGAAGFLALRRRILKTA